MYYKKRPEIMQLGQEIEPHNPDISTFFSWISNISFYSCLWKYKLFFGCFDMHG
jgi:hypothetical protein